MGFNSGFKGLTKYGNPQQTTVGPNQATFCNAIKFYDIEKKFL